MLRRQSSWSLVQVGAELLQHAVDLGQVGLDVVLQRRPDGDDDRVGPRDDRGVGLDEELAAGDDLVVAGLGERHPAAVDRGAQRLVDVQADGLDPASIMDSPSGSPTRPVPTMQTS